MSEGYGTMRIVTYGISHPANSNPTFSIVPLATSASGSNCRRYSLHCDRMATVNQQLPLHHGDGQSSKGADPTRHCRRHPYRNGTTLSFHGEDDPKCPASIALRARPSRKLRYRGWEELPIRGMTEAEKRFRAVRLHRRTRGELEETILIFRSPPTMDFMAYIPDETPLGELTMPGTHDSAALYGFPFSQCQQPSTPIFEQLLDGIRFFDIRLRVVGDDLLVYHGPLSERSNFTTILEALYEFLGNHPTETLILSIKEEIPPNHPRFSAMIYEAIRPRLDRWLLEQRIPTLGEVRGKGILLSRFDAAPDARWEKGIGIHPTQWPNSRRGGFEWDCGGTTFRTQDWYDIPFFIQIPEKFQMIIDHLTPTLHPPVEPQFSLSFTSASGPLAFPTIIAKGIGWPQWGLGVEGVNSRFCRWLLERLADGQRVRGCVPMDFYRESGDREVLSELLVLMNLM